jgi:hypothetical protein
MAKVVINKCFGGFGLSEAAKTRYAELKGLVEVYDWEINRDDPILVQVVEEFGKDANDSFSDLKIVDIPKGTLYRIDEYDGRESIEYAGDIKWNVG